MSKCPITRLYDLMLEKHWDDDGLLNEIQVDKDWLIGVLEYTRDYGNPSNGKMIDEALARIKEKL